MLLIFEYNTYQKFDQHNSIACQDFSYHRLNKNNYLPKYEDRKAPIFVHNGNDSMVQQSSNGNHMAILGIVSNLYKSRWAYSYGVDGESDAKSDNKSCQDDLEAQTCTSWQRLLS